MTIGLSFLLGLLAGSVSYFMLGLWWPVAVLLGLFAWLAFGLLEVKMDSTFTLPVSYTHLTLPTILLV